MTSILGRCQWPRRPTGATEEALLLVKDDPLVWSRNNCFLPEKRRYRIPPESTQQRQGTALHVNESLWLPLWLEAAERPPKSRSDAPSGGRLVTGLVLPTRLASLPMSDNKNPEPKSRQEVHADRPPWVRARLCYS